MSAAERMKKYRQNMKNNPEKYTEYLSKEKQRYRKRKANGEIPNIKQCTDREKRKLRRKWRNAKRKLRKETKEKSILTPPPSPHSVDESQSDSRKRGRLRVKRDRAKAYKKISKLEKALDRKTKDAEKYRKRYERLKKKISNSPRSELTKTLKGHALPNKVRRQLLFNNVVVKEIKEKMNNARSERKKQLISRIVCGKLVRHYKLMGLAKTMNISYKRLRTNEVLGNNLVYTRKTKKNTILNRNVQECIMEFLERDVNTRLLPGKGDTITRKGVKKQKRILNDTLQNLHKSFCSTFPSTKCSYASFCRWKPFWIIDPKCKQRDTCYCRLHANMQYMMDRLREHKVIKKQSMRELCEKICCSPVTKECMYRECKMCEGKQIEFENEDDIKGKQVWVYTWKNKHEERESVKPNGEKRKFSVQVTVKEKVFFTLENLLVEMNRMMNSKICRHLFNIRHQYEQVRYLKENLGCNECIIHVDFSENYACKLESEVQGMHFGASRNQVSLHTGVLYKKDSDPVSFRTISGNTRHDPAAIWAHLTPILSQLKEKSPDLDTIHFLSDGPTTQYRSRKNFFLMTEVVHNTYGFEKLTWNFTEAGHGKGDPDGVGGLIKRTADKLVSHGNDISDANEFYHAMKNAGLALGLHMIADDSIFAMDKTSSVSLKPLPGTMTIHQVVSHRSMSSSNVLRTRQLSCFCSKSLDCPCFNPKQAAVVQQDGVFMTEKATKSSSETTLEGSTKSTQSERDHSNTQLYPLSHGNADVDLVGKWCVVVYDKMPYPGVIQDVDHDSAEVKVMHKIGTNRFFWPMLEDVIWYNYEHVVMLIPEPEPVTKRHVQINAEVWLKITEALEM